MDKNLSFEQVSAEEIDALKELGNIGVAHAASSLSTMIGKIVEMSVPNVILAKISEIHKYFQEKIVTGVVTALEEVENGRSGYLYILFPEAKKLANLLIEDSTLIDSTIMEIGNIISSSFCNAIADMLGIMLIPSPPSLSEDMSVAIIEAIVAQIAEKGDSIIIFETELKEKDNAIDILITLVPDEKFLSYIMKMFGMLG
ncbi:MAG: chemotaxis protein CheC [Archaeoglobaceae archaeon]|nr:chemotaxis protein CheC [Archaeoglobaceae archaeon]MDW7989081.1 chemotaxis protein CheC [Archaeoglobaceae archaeon]